MSPQELCEFKETISGFGWKVYMQILAEEIKSADNRLHQANTFEEFKQYQGYYNAIKRVILLPDLIIQKNEALKS